MPEIRDGEAIVVPKRRGEYGSKMEKTIVVPNRIEDEEEETMLKWRMEEAVVVLERSGNCARMKRDGV